MNRINIFFLLFLGGLLLGGCGTTTGNALVKSAAFNTTGNSFISKAVTNVTSFKLCVKKIQLQDDSDNYKEKDGTSEISFSPGLIDLSSGATATWGRPDIPVDFNLKRIKIHIRKDAGVCGVDYAVKFNDFTSNSNTILTFRFNPAVSISNDSVFTISLSQIVAALRNAADGGNLNNGNLKDTLESTEDSAEHSHDR